MPMNKMMTVTYALALGVASVAAPAMAQTQPQDKADQKANQIEQKGETKAQKYEQKADKERAKADQKAEEVREGTTGSTSEGTMGRAWDKTKQTTKEATDKVKETFSGKHAQEAVDVRGAQQALRDKGFDPGPVDGKMGPRTSAAIRDFQSKEGISATGQLAAETRTRLMASNTGSSSSPAASPSTTSDSSTKAPKK